MPKRVFIVHGYGGNPSKNWFPWLRHKLETLGIEVHVPQMPNTDSPELSEWLPYLHQLVGESDKETFLVGHSLGCITILRYMESLNDNETIGGSILVAGFSEPIHLTELNNFLQLLSYPNEYGNLRIKWCLSIRIMTNMCRYGKVKEWRKNSVPN